MVLSVDGMGQQTVERGEVMPVLSLLTEERLVGLLADADVQAEDVGAVQVRGDVKVLIVFGHDRGERELAIGVKLATRVVDEEAVAPRYLGRSVSW